MNIPFLTNYLEYRSDVKAFRKAAKSYVGGSFGFIDLFAAASGYGGDKFNTGFGITKDFQVVNLKLLQFRSIQLIRENLYANALFSRLETAVINKGLTLNSAPMFDILGPKFNLSDEDLRKWSRNVEARFLAWSRDNSLVSWNKQYDFSKIQRLAYHTAHLSGDCLVIITLNKSGLPVIKLVDGFHVSNPFKRPNTGNRIVHGVEIDKNGNEVAYWVEKGANPDNLKPQQLSATSLLGHVRVPAFARGKRRRRAWLIKLTQQRIDDVRGMPLLALILQNINEIGKYMDSEQRAALVNSYLAMTRNRDPKQGAAAGGFRRRSPLRVTQKETETAGTVQFEQQQPGLFLANLAQDEKVESFDTKRPNDNFGSFLEASLKPVAYANEIPPEKFFMEYGNNFSASRQADLDFKSVADKKGFDFARQLNDPVYVELLTGEVLNGSIVAPGYVNSLMSLGFYDVRNAWQYAIWRGLPQTSVDIKKMVQALDLVEQKSWMTNEAISEQYFKTDFFDNVRRQKTENELRAAARAPLNIDQNTNNSVDTDDRFEAVHKKLEEFSASIEEIEETLENTTVNKE